MCLRMGMHVCAGSHGRQRPATGVIPWILSIFEAESLTRTGLLRGDIMGVSQVQALPMGLVVILVVLQHTHY